MVNWREIMWYEPCQNKSYNVEAPTGSILLKRCSCKFAKFTGKYLWQSLFFNNIAGLGLKKDAPIQVFSREFCEIFKFLFYGKLPWSCFGQYSHRLPKWERPWKQKSASAVNNRIVRFIFQNPKKSWSRCSFLPTYGIIITNNTLIKILEKFDRTRFSNGTDENVFVVSSDI